MRNGVVTKARTSAKTPADNRLFLGSLSSDFDLVGARASRVMPVRLGPWGRLAELDFWRHFRVQPDRKSGGRDFPYSDYCRYVTGDVDR